MKTIKLNPETLRITSSQLNFENFNYSALVYDRSGEWSLTFHFVCTVAMTIKYAVFLASADGTLEGVTGETTEPFIGPELAAVVSRLCEGYSIELKEDQE